MGEFAGTLRERITFERQVAVRSAAGLRDGGWERFADCLAAVVFDAVGAEAEGMSLSAMPRFRVSIRMRDEIAVDQRVRWKGRLLMVRQLLFDPRLPDRLTLKCEEVRS
ncbi:head-tail adaptor protein [Sphingomonas arenae]|uniref:phage head completion protein n=1 Tax=Sphingomonas arenae TaxID=2812555 RepID=UPI00196841EA|nr:head-tail adaptor protein [Sphingomonas arenae]